LWWQEGSICAGPAGRPVLDLSKTGGGTVAGLLGSDELRHFSAVTINFSHQQLQLAQP
jgi:hypothetical protein